MPKTILFHLKRLIAKSKAESNKSGKEEQIKEKWLVFPLSLNDYTTYIFYSTYTVSVYNQCKFCLVNSYRPTQHVQNVYHLTKCRTVHVTVCTVHKSGTVEGQVKCAALTGLLDTLTLTWGWAKSRQLMREDFPTLLRPRKQTCKWTNKLIGNN